VPGRQASESVPQPPAAGPAAGKNFVFVTGGIEAAVAKAKEIAGAKNIVVNGGQIARRRLEVGLFDGAASSSYGWCPGRHSPFADMATTPAQFEGPIRVAEGTGISHIRYRVKK
jgi:hypothetical protein